MASGRCSPMDSSPCTNQTGSNLMVLAQRNIYINGVARTGIYLTSEFVSISGLLEKIPSVVGRRLCFETRPLYKNIANPITKCWGEGQKRDFWLRLRGNRAEVHTLFLYMCSLNCPLFRVMCPFIWNITYSNGPNKGHIGDQLCSVHYREVVLFSEV